MNPSVDTTKEIQLFQFGGKGIPVALSVMAVDHDDLGSLIKGSSRAKSRNGLHEGTKKRTKTPTTFLSR
jgi:hypothetical protein